MYFRLMAANFDLPVTPTSESIYNSCTVLLDPKNVGVAGHPDVGEYSNMCHRVAGPQKIWDAVGNLVISRSNHDIRSNGRHFDFGGRGLTFVGS